MPEAEDLLGRTIAGRFTLEAHVGGGAMGDVFRARHNALGSTVAVKIMRADLAKDAMFRERFNREAKAASRLDHPNSVRVIDYGHEPDGLVYLAMEFLGGRTLLELLKAEWPIDDARIVDILGQTLAALSVAHGLGIVHRDLKPENIMVVTSTDEDEGTIRDHVKVCDFGIAKLSDPRAFQTENDGKALTKSGTLIGTPEYMSPEQARGDPLDARSDLYSVGVILYQLLTGHVPFTAENALGVVLKQVTDKPLPPHALRASVNRKLEAVCLRALEKSRDDRHQTAKEMRAELRAAIGRRALPSTNDESGPWKSEQVGIEVSKAPTVPSRAVNADAIETLVAPVASGRNLSDFEPKQTSDGTALPVPPAPQSRALVVAVAALALVLGVVLVVAFTRRGPDAKEAASVVTAPPTTSASASSVAVTAPPPKVEATGAATDPPPRPPRVAAPATTAVARAASHPTASAASSRPVAPSASFAPSAAPPAPPPEPSAPYNPSGAFVSLGALTTERVSVRAVKQKMGELLPRLSECYRTSLRMTGAPLGGAASVNLSIDDKGVMQAIVSAPKHPEFARCAQGALAGQRLTGVSLEPSGATAEQWLTLVP
jgi:serine/threonine-protein kinase